MLHIRHAFHWHGASHGTDAACITYLSVSHDKYQADHVQCDMQVKCATHALASRGVVICIWQISHVAYYVFSLFFFFSVLLSSLLSLCLSPSVLSLSLSFSLPLSLSRVLSLLVCCPFPIEFAHSGFVVWVEMGIGWLNRGRYDLRLSLPRAFIRLHAFKQSMHVVRIKDDVQRMFPYWRHADLHVACCIHTDRSCFEACVQSVSTWCTSKIFSTQFTLQ